jgi:hypothetical protein
MKIKKKPFDWRSAGAMTSKSEKFQITNQKSPILRSKSLLGNQESKIDDE